MKRLLGSTLAHVGLLALPTISRADKFFNFSYDFEGQKSDAIISGILRTSDLDTTTNAYTILGLTGTRTYGGETKTISGLIAPGAFYGNDNLLYNASQLLDNNGFSYILEDGYKVNVHFDTGTNRPPDRSYEEESSPDVGYGTFTVTPSSDVTTPVPEPAFVAMSSLLALGGGSLLLGRRKVSAQNAS